MKIQPISFSPYVNKGRDLNNGKAGLPVVDNANLKNQQLSNLFYYPVSFSSKAKRTYGSDKTALQEKSGDFKVATFNDITCPSCGKKMCNKAFLKKIETDLDKLQPDEYLDYIGQYYDYMRPVEASVYDEISAAAKQPGASKDIRTLIVALRAEKLPVLQSVQMRLIKKMRALAKTLPHDEKEVLLHKLDSLSKIVKQNKSTSPFRRKIMIERMSKIKIRNPKKYNKLQAYVNRFPTSMDMNSAWIVKYSGTNKEGLPWDSKEIALRFLASSVANTDHILAYNIEPNHDDITNYMAMHTGCNSEKSNKPFLQWLNENKDARIKYMKQYFTDVDEIISSGKLKKKKYRNYVALATNTVEHVSKGQLGAEMIKPEHVPSIYDIML